VSNGSHTTSPRLVPSHLWATPVPWFYRVWLRAKRSWQGLGRQSSSKGQVGSAIHQGGRRGLYAGRRATIPGYLYSIHSKPRGDRSATPDRDGFEALAIHGSITEPPLVEAARHKTCPDALSTRRLRRPGAWSSPGLERSSEHWYTRSLLLSGTRRQNCADACGSAPLTDDPSVVGARCHRSTSLPRAKRLPRRGRAPFVDVERQKRGDKFGIERWTTRRPTDDLVVNAQRWPLR
jgi:hypothetical protein